MNKSNIFKLSLCALTAFVVAHSLGLPNAYWASMPIWVIPGISREELILKGFYRVLGTVFGGFLALLIIALPFNIIGKVLLITFFISLFTATAKTQKALYGYSNLLTAITLTIVALPGLIAEDAWAIMTARLSCTLIGVFAAILFLIIESKRTYNTHAHIPSFTFNRYWNKVKTSEFQKTFSLIFSITLFAFAVILWGIDHKLATDSELLAFGMIVFAIVLGVHDTPKTQSRFVLTGAILGSTIALLYRFYLHPHLENISSIFLYISLIPFFLIGAFFKTSSFETKGAVDANLCFLLIAKPGNFAINFSNYIAHLKFLLLGAMLITLLFQLPYFQKTFKRDSERCL